MFKNVLTEMRNQTRARGFLGAKGMAINSIYEKLFCATLVGMEYAYFFDTDCCLDDVSRIAEEEGLCCEDSSAAVGGRCLRVWGW